MPELYIPEHKVTFHLTHNQHMSYYETVEQTVRDESSGYYALKSFISPEDRQRCIDTNELWTAQWYPETPGGFHVLHASSLEVLNAALAEFDRS